MLEQTSAATMAIMLREPVPNGGTLDLALFCNQILTKAFVAGHLTALPLRMPALHRPAHR